MTLYTASGGLQRLQHEMQDYANSGPISEGSTTSAMTFLIIAGLVCAIGIYALSQNSNK